jgi:hypothetical protein
VEHREACRSYLTPEGLRDQYVHGVQDPSLIDPDDWVIDKVLIDRPGVGDIMIDLLYDIRNNVPNAKAMQKFMRERRPPTLVATGSATTYSLSRWSGRSSTATLAPSTTAYRPVTSRWRTRGPRSPH